MKRKLSNLFKKTEIYDDKRALIVQKIALELLERLNLFHYFQPNAILDIGCDTGYCLKLLQTIYPKAKLFGLDSSHTKLKQAKLNTYKWYRPSPILILADIEKLQFIDQQFDLICANLSLLWTSELNQCLSKLKKLLKPNGLLLFTMLGPDTFKELRYDDVQLNNTQMSQPAFYDIHNLGDMLMQHQFQDIVMDTSYLNVHYTNSENAYQDIKHMGFVPLLGNIQDSFHRQALSKTSVTWEIVYAQAWKLQYKAEALDTSPDEMPIAFNKRRRK